MLCVCVYDFRARWMAASGRERLVEREEEGGGGGGCVCVSVSVLVLVLIMGMVGAVLFFFVCS